MEKNTMNDEKINKVVNIVLICVGAILGILLIDLLIFKLTGFGPIFATKDKTNTDTVKLYHGVFYNAYKCDAKKYPRDSVIRLFGGKYDCDKAPVKGLSKNDFIIQDETGVCADMLEEIARDDRFIYYLSCTKSTTVFLKYGNGDKISVKEALKSKKVTVRDLIDKGLKVFQEVIAK